MPPHNHQRPQDTCSDKSPLTTSRMVAVWLGLLGGNTRNRRLCFVGGWRALPLSVARSGAVAPSLASFASVVSAPISIGRFVFCGGVARVSRPAAPAMPPPFTPWGAWLLSLQESCAAGGCGGRGFGRRAWSARNSRPFGAKPPKSPFSLKKTKKSRFFLKKAKKEVPVFGT